MAIIHTLTEIEAALSSMIKSITWDNGYNTNFDPKNVLSNVRDEEPSLQGDDEIKNFPRAIIQLFGEEYEYAPTSQVYKSSIWYIGATLLVNQDELDTLNKTVQDLIIDMETALMGDYTLGGKAISAQIVDSVYDQGYLDIGVAVVMFRIRVNYIAHRR